MRQMSDFSLLRYLDLFLALAEEASFTGAAKRLGITQSAVSQQVQALEQEVGYALFLRDRRPLRLSAGGRMFHARAQAVARELAKMQADRARILKSLPSLDVGMLASIAPLVSPIAARMARAELGAERVSIRTGLATDHLRLLNDEEVELVITSDPLLDLEGLYRRDILSETFLLVLPKGQRKGADDLAQLAAARPFVRFGPAAPAGKAVDQHLRRCGTELPRQIEMDHVAAVIAAVEAGEGFAILSPTLLIEALQRQAAITIRPLPLPELTRAVLCIYREKRLSAFAGKLSLAVREALKVFFAQHGRALPQGSVSF